MDLNGVSSVDSQGALVVQSLMETSPSLQHQSEEDQDIFQCGRCKKQCTSLVSFMNHKKSGCTSYAQLLGQQAVTINNPLGSDTLTSLEDGGRDTLGGDSSGATTAAQTALDLETLDSTTALVPVSTGSESVLPDEEATEGPIASESFDMASQASASVSNTTAYSLARTEVLSQGTITLPSSTFTSSILSEDLMTLAFDQSTSGALQLATINGNTYLTDTNSLQALSSNTLMAASAATQSNMSSGLPIASALLNSAPALATTFSKPIKPRILKEQPAKAANVLSAVKLDNDMTESPLNNVKVVMAGTKSDVTRSKRSRGSESKSQECVDCGKLFTKHFDLVQHQRCHTGEKPFQCVVCGRAFAQKSNVKKHMKTHKVWPKQSRTLPDSSKLPSTASLTTSCSTTSASLATNRQLASSSFTDNLTCMIGGDQMTMDGDMLPGVELGGSVDGASHDDLDTSTEQITLNENGDVTGVMSLTVDKLKGTDIPSTVQLDLRTYPVKSENQGLSPTSEPAIHEVLTLEKEFCCQYCQETFPTYMSLRAHMVTHRQVQMYKCTLSRCGEMFAELDPFLDHMQTHESEMTYHCHNCRRAFNSLTELAAHQLNKAESCRPDTRVYTCTICKNKYNTPEGLSNHMATTTHEYPCNQCESVFKCERYLRRHLATHGSKDIHTCSVCGKQFKKESYLKAHLVVHSSERPFVCEVCDAAFGRKDRLLRHKLIHRTDKPLKCPFQSVTGCTLSFHRADKLKMHIISHSGIRPFRCNECGHSFSRKNYLREHEMCHRNEYRYRCDKCNRGFQRVKLYQNHNCNGVWLDKPSVVYRTRKSKRKVRRPRKRMIHTGSDNNTSKEEDSDARVGHHAVMEKFVPEVNNVIKGRLCYSDSHDVSTLKIEQVDENLEQIETVVCGDKRVHVEIMCDEDGGMLESQDGARLITIERTLDSQQDMQLQTHHEAEPTLQSIATSAIVGDLCEYRSDTNASAALQAVTCGGDRGTTATIIHTADGVATIVMNSEGSEGYLSGLVESVNGAIVHGTTSLPHSSSGDGGIDSRNGATSVADAPPTTGQRVEFVSDVQDVISSGDDILCSAAAAAAVGTDGDMDGVAGDSQDQAGFTVSQSTDYTGYGAVTNGNDDTEYTQHHHSNIFGDSSELMTTSSQILADDQ